MGPRPSRAASAVCAVVMHDGSAHSVRKAAIAGTMWGAGEPNSRTTRSSHAAASGAVARTVCASARRSRSAEAAAAPMRSGVEAPDPGPNANTDPPPPPRAPAAGLARGLPSGMRGPPTMLVRAAAPSPLGGNPAPAPAPAADALPCVAASAAAAAAAACARGEPENARVLPEPNPTAAVGPGAVTEGPAPLLCCVGVLGIGNIAGTIARDDALAGIRAADPPRKKPAPADVAAAGVGASHRAGPALAW